MDQLLFRQSSGDKYSPLNYKWVNSVLRNFWFMGFPIWPSIICWLSKLTISHQPHASVDPWAVERSDVSLLLQPCRGVNWIHRKSIAGVFSVESMWPVVSFTAVLRSSWSWWSLLHSHRLEPHSHVLSQKARAGPIILTQLYAASTSCFLYSHRRMPPERLSVTANRNTVSGTVKKLWYLRC